jgi:GNAT superfamily N-acetyltransferase
MTLRFAPLGPADITVAAQVINGAYRGGDDGVGWTHERDLVGGDRISPQELADDLARNPHAALLGAWSPEGNLLGTVWLNPTADPHVWYLGLLAVGVEGQAGGVGRGLIAAGEAFAAARGGLRMRLTVIDIRDDLIAWYVRRGYEPTGRFEPFPQGYRVLRSGIRLNVLEKAIQ